MGAVERLYETLANVEGRAAQGRRELWGGAIANIGQIPGQIAQQQRQQALTLLEQARELRARGEYDLAQKKFAEAERTHQNQKQITAAMFADPEHPNVPAGVAKAIELGDDPAFAYELGEKIAPKVATAPPGSSARWTTGPQAGQVVPGSEVAEKITYTEPKPMMVGGKRQLVRTATQGAKTWTVDLQGTPIDATIEPDQPPKSLQSENFLLDGKPVKGTFDPLAGTYGYQGQDVTGRAKPIPPASLVLANQPPLELPSWASDASRPAGAEGNRIDPKLGLSPNALYQGAITWMTTGSFPPTGRGNDPRSFALRTAIQNKAGAIAADAGMDIDGFRAFYKANASSLTQLQKSYDSAASFLATADKNSVLLEKSLAKIPDIGSPVFNKPLRAFAQSVSGNADLSQFGVYLQSIQNEYARILTQPNLAGQLTDSARKEAEQLVSGTATVPQIIKSLQALRAEGDNRLVSLGDQIQQIRGRMRTPGGGGGGTGGGAITVTAPDGSQHSFATQAQADAFKKLAGIP